MNKSSDVNNIVAPKKRGRKSKKEIEEAQLLKQASENNITVEFEENTAIDDVIINDNNENNSNNQNSNNVNNINHAIISNEIHFSITADDDKPVSKKRGRKPKGGKIIQQSISLNNNKEDKPNVILHLKCSLKDLQTNILGNNIDCFTFPTGKPDLSYEIIGANKNIENIVNTVNNTNSQLIQNTFNIINNDSLTNTEVEIYDEDTDDVMSKNKESNIRGIWKKLKQLEHDLHINNISDKKSACFWCTCDFDNPPIYIPKHHIKDSYHVYGCFCSPECATAHLMEENIDSSIKFERYHLINHIYSKIYDYKKNIKPAPNPFYMLDKYYGNLTIQEYRSLLSNDRLFLVVDKPLTRLLPELHEDNDDFIINHKIIPSNTYQIKKKMQKKQQTKNNIVNETFGANNQQ